MSAATWLTTREVAEEIKKSENYVSRQCNAGNLRATKLGNEWRISREALDEFMGGTVPPARPRMSRRQRIAVEQRRRSA